VSTEELEPKASVDRQTSVPGILDLRADALLLSLLRVLTGSPAAGLSGNTKLDRVPIDDLSSLMERNEPFRRRVQNLYTGLFAHAPLSTRTDFFSLVAQFPLRGASPAVSQGFSDALEILGDEQRYWTLSIDPGWNTSSSPTTEALRWFEAMAANQVGNTLEYRWRALLLKAQSVRVCLAAWAGHAVSNPRDAVATMGTLLRKAIENPSQAKPFGVGTLIGSFLPTLEPSAPAIEEARNHIWRTGPEIGVNDKLSPIIARALSINPPEVCHIWDTLLDRLLTPRPIFDLKTATVAPKAARRYSSALEKCSRYRSENFSLDRAA
jgi:hypothetical protein